MTQSLFAALDRLYESEAGSDEAEEAYERLEDGLQAMRRLLDLPLPISLDERKDWLTYAWRLKERLASYTEAE